MRQALLVAGPPTAIFVALWFYVRAENNRADQASRRRLALLASGIFLFLPWLAPPVYDAGHTAELQAFLVAVCSACALGLALAALRTMPTRKVAPLVLILMSGAVVTLSFLG